jgi:2-keto-4-pentenoate hydratase/2-oxohepta-3-ene-1,7-dioic acid hydratase in catechol pathway
VLLTGTPWGCGEFMDPPRSLQHGDVVEVEIDGIGILRNPVVETGR